MANDELKNNPDAMKVALRQLQIKYVIKAIEESLPIVSEPLAKFESDHMDRISKMSLELSKEDNYKIAIGAHSLEKSVGNVLSISNIIVVTTFLDQVKDISGYGNSKLGQFGNKISDSITWAKGIRCASNYVRHLREWHIPTFTFSKQAEEFVSEKIQNLLDLVTRNDTKNNVETLVHLGFEAEDILGKGSNISFQISKRLELTDTEKTLENFKVWAIEVSDELERDLINV